MVQQDVCNGCGYCVPACPYGVIDQRGGRRPGVEVHDVLRPRSGRVRNPPAPKTCPTDSIQFGELDELRERAQRAGRAAADQRVRLGARLYGHDPNDGVGGTGAFFLLLDQPEVYGLPPDPVVTTRDLRVPCGGTRRWPAALVAGGVAASWGGRT